MLKLNNPLEQFELSNYLVAYAVVDLSINKVGIYLLIVLLCLIMLHLRRYELTNNLIDFLVKQFSFNVIMSKYTVLLISLFFFILLSNLVGLIPYSYSITSQFVFTFVIGFTVLITITVKSIYNFGFSWINLFIPQGIPKVLLPFIFLIEFVSYFMRFLSLPIRLSANMIAGHAILSIFSSFLLVLTIPIVGTPLIMVLYLLEIGVSIVQSFVFVLLISVYLKNIWYLH